MKIKSTLSDDEIKEIVEFEDTVNYPEEVEFEDTVNYPEDAYRAVADAAATMERVRIINYLKQCSEYPCMRAVIGNLEDDLLV